MILTVHVWFMWSLLTMYHACSTRSNLCTSIHSTCTVQVQVCSGIHDVLTYSCLRATSLFLYFLFKYITLFFLRSAARELSGSEELTERDINCEEIKVSVMISPPWFRRTKFLKPFHEFLDTQFYAKFWIISEYFFWLCYIRFSFNRFIFRKRFGHLDKSWSRSVIWTLYKLSFAVFTSFTCTCN